MKRKITVTLIITLFFIPQLLVSQNDCLDPPVNYNTPTNFKIGSFDGKYLTYQEYLDELDKMFTLYPNLISEKSPIGDFLTIGEPDDSVTPSIGNNPIYWIKISDNPSLDEDEPEILYDSQIHGNEWGTLSQSIFFMWYLLENYENDATIKSIVDHTELYFIPVVNPDGYLFGEKDESRTGRKNRNIDVEGSVGVDVNRNFDYFINGNPQQSTWGTGFNEELLTDPTSYSYAGTHAFSEIEAQAYKWFIENHEFVLNNSYHSLLADFINGFHLFPFLYSNTPINDRQAFIEMMEYISTENNYSFTGLNRSFVDVGGTSIDFNYGTLGNHSPILSITTEIPEGDTVERMIEINKDVLSQNIKMAQMALNLGKVLDTQNQFIGASLISPIKFDFKRIGLKEGDFKIKIEPISNNILSKSEVLVIKDLGFLESLNSELAIKLDPSIAIGDEITYNIIVDNGFYTTSNIFTKTYGEPTNMVFNNGDTLDGFITENQENVWKVTTENAYKDASAIEGFTNRTNNVFYLEGENSVSLENSIAANVSFMTKYDVAVVEFQVSLDRINWNSLCGKFTEKTENESFKNIPIYSSVMNSWQLEEIDLSEYLEEEIYYRFVIHSYDSWDSMFLIDNFSIDVLKENQNSDTYIEFYPNPTEDYFYIATNYTNYSYAIFDTLGKLVFQKENCTNSQVINTEAFSNGTYLLKVLIGNEEKTFKLVKK